MSTKTGTGLSSNPDYSQAAKEAVNQALSYLNNETPDLLLVFSSTAYDYSKLLEAISKESNTTNIVGASTAGEFNQSSVSRNSVSIMAIKSDTIKFVPVLSRDSKGRYKEVAENIFGDFKEQLQLMGRDGLRYPTILLMMDAMMGSGEELVKDIYSKTGILSQIVGGAAGDDAKLEKTHVFFGTEALENSIVFVKMFSKSKIGIGVSHGMKNATKPMKVTKSVGGVLYELDGKPAYQVYKDYAETKNVTLSPENTFEFLINNNLAIQDLTFSKIRAPLGANEDGSLVMATEVPQGCMVTIADADKDNLLQAAKEASKEALNNLGANKAAGIIVFDCVCRQTILGDNFIKEINSFESVFGQVPIVGFSTYGEIAKFGGKFNGFHNSTAVVCALPE